MTVKKQQSVNLDCSMLDALPADMRGSVRYGTMRAGETLLSTDERVEFVYFLLFGRVCASNLLINGEEYQYALFDSPMVFGEFEAFAGCEWYRGEIRCDSDIRYAMLPVQNYLKWIRTDSELLYSRTCEIIRNLTRQTRREREFLFMSSSDRIRSFLSENARKEQNARVLYMTCRQLADATRCSEKTVQRELAKLRKLDMIQTKRGEIRLTRSMFGKNTTNNDEE